MTAEEIVAALEAAAADMIVDAHALEGGSLDFKRDPYGATAKEKFELAKDITALANVSGGIIVLGFATEARETSLIEGACSKHPFDLSGVNRDSYLDRIQDLIFPQVVGIDVRVFPEADGAATGYAVISVPEQDDRMKYFLVLQPHIGDERAPGWMFGVHLRSADRTINLRREQLHSLISQSRTMSDDLSAIREAVVRIEAALSGSEAPAVAPPEERIRVRADQGIEEFGS